MSERMRNRFRFLPVPPRTEDADFSPEAVETEINDILDGLIDIVAAERTRILERRTSSCGRRDRLRAQVAAADRLIAIFDGMRIETRTLH